MANFDPTARGALVYAQRRLAGRSRAGQPGQEQLRAARRRHLPHQRPDAAPRRLRNVLQPVRAHRLGRSARAESAGTAQHPGQFGVGRHHAGVLHERRLPGELSRSVEPRHPQPEAARRVPGRAADDGPAVRRRHRTRADRQHGGVGRRDRFVHEKSRGAAQSQSAAARHARRQRRGAVSEFRQHPGARDERRSQLQGRRPLVRKAVQRRLRLSRVVHHRRSARPGARAPQRLVRPRAEHARSRVVGRPERLRHPSSLRRQLHRRTAVRRGQADAAGRRRPRRFSAAGW